MNILGISCFDYDSAACVVRDGKILAAAQEERFSRKKYDPRFPVKAIQWCLDYAGIKPQDLDFIACRANNEFEKLKIILRWGLFRKTKILFFNSSDSFRYSAFYPSPFTDAVILVNNQPALTYSAISRYLGLKDHGDEFKVMGLSAYGKPIYKDIILKYEDKSPGYLPAGKEGSASPGISQYQMDVAASLQAAVEEKVLAAAAQLYESTKNENLCISGIMGLNCLINTKILKQGLFKNIWVQPASGNSGCAIGAALAAWDKRGNERKVFGQDMMQGSLLGPEYSNAYIEGFLKREKIPYSKLADSEIAGTAADLIAQSKIIGWFQGRAEFGPRSLGNRSILGDSRNSSMHKKLNLEVKKREPFRPFAPTVLGEKAGEYFDWDRESPYMLFTAQVRPEKKNEIPAVTHVDGSSRLQTLKKEDNPLFYSLLNEFYKKTGCPVIINTSFNSGPEPMVLSPEDAYRCFKAAKIDSLIMGCFLVTK